MGRPRSKPLPQTSVDSNGSNGSNSSDASPKKREQLKAIRELKGLTQLELADLLGTTPLNVSRWERGVTRPTPYFRSKLTKIFGKSEEELGLRMSLSDDSETSQTTDLSIPTSPSSINSNIRSSQKLPENISNSGENTDVSEEMSADAALSVSPVVAITPIIDPAIPVRFTELVGRDDELAHIKEQLCKGSTVALTALNGLPGVGKTALSITLAHDKEIREHFRHGVLWAGLGLNPDVNVILRRWGTLLGLPETAFSSESTEQWAKKVRDAIASYAMLIVLDDVWDEQHAKSLRIGGTQSAYLITTRYPTIATRFTARGTTTLHELDEAKSLELMEQLAPGVVELERQRVLDLIHAVGGLPLALTLAGNYLREQAYSANPRRIREAFALLSDTASRLQLSDSDDPIEGHPSLAATGKHISLQTLFAVTDDQLDETQRAAFYALSVFPPKPDDFSEESALAIADCTSDVLDKLLDRGLLESKGNGRYTLHQTIADYARLKLYGRGKTQEIQSRLIAYALATIKHHRKDYDILEREQSIILHALDTAHALNLTSELIQGATGFTPFLLLRALYDHAKTHLERAHEQAMKTHNERGIASTLLYLGELNLRQNHYKEANMYLEEGLKLARELKDKELICDLLINLGGVAWKLGENTNANKHFQEGLKIAQELKDVERTCNLLKSLDLVADSMGESEKGLAYLYEGVELARQAGHREQLCNMLINLGVSISNKGDYLLAKSLYQEGLLIAKQIGHKEWIIALLNNLGDVLVIQKRYEQAEKYFREGLETALQIHNREWLSLLYLNIGMVMREQRRFVEAKQLMQRGLDIAQQIGIPYIIYNGFYEFGLLSLQQQHLQEAEDTFYRMFNVTSEGDQEFEALARYGLAQVAKANNNEKNAKQLASESKKVLREIGHRKADEVEQWMKTELRVAC